MNQPVLLFLLSELDRVTEAIRELIHNEVDFQIDKPLAIAFNRLKRDYSKPRSDKGKPRNPPPAPKKRGRPPKSTEPKPAGKRGWPKGKKRGPRVAANGRKVARARAFVFGKNYSPKKPADVAGIVAAATAKLVKPRPHAEPKIHDITPKEARAAAGE